MDTDREQQNTHVFSFENYSDFKFIGCFWFHCFFFFALIIFQSKSGKLLKTQNMPEM